MLCFFANALTVMTVFGRLFQWCGTQVWHCMLVVAGCKGLRPEPL